MTLGNTASSHGTGSANNFEFGTKQSLSPDERAFELSRLALNVADIIGLTPVQTPIYFQLITEKGKLDA